MRARLLFPFALLLAAGAAQAQVKLNEITSVSVKDEGTRIAIVIQGSRPPNFTTFSMADPPRFVIDLSESRFQGVPADIDVGDGFVNVIKNLSYGSDVTSIARVMVAFAVEVDPPETPDTAGNTLIVRFAKPAGAVAVAKAEEADRRAKEEAEAKARAEVEAKARADAQSKALADAAAIASAAKVDMARAEQERADARARADQERRERELADAKAKEEAASQAAAEARAREIKARADATQGGAAGVTAAVGAVGGAGDAVAATTGDDEKLQERNPALSASEQARIAREQLAAEKKAAADRKAQEAADAKLRADEERKAREAERLAKADADRLAREEAAAAKRAAADDAKLAREQAAAEKKAAAELAAAEKKAAAEQAAADRRAAAERKKLEVAEAKARAEEDRKARAEQAKAERDAVVLARADRLVSGGPVSRLKEIGFKQLPGTSRVFVRTDVMPRFTIQDVGEDVVRVEFENTRVARRNDTRFMDTSFFPSAVALITPSKRGDSYVVEIKLKQRVPYQQKVEGDLLAIDFERPAGAAAPAAAEPAGTDPGADPAAEPPADEPLK